MLNTQEKKMAVWVGLPVGLMITLIILAFLTAGINDAGKRTVVQWPNGKLFTKFEPGVYFKFFGTSTEYNDVITFDFDATVAPGNVTLDRPGIPVRFQMGGKGTMFGKARFALPNDEPNMLKLHKETRSNKAVAEKIILPVTESTLDKTAGLFNSEEVYATKRAIVEDYAKMQIMKGKFLTEVKVTTTTDPVTGKSVEKEVPVPLMKDGKFQHDISDLKRFGITLVGFNLNDPGFEPDTQTQIANKRQIAMNINIAKTKAEEAKQNTITEEESGKARVMTAKYKEEELKIQQVVQAQRIAEVAVLKAKQLVDVAAQSKLQAVQAKLEAAEYKQEQILRGEGDAAYKKKVMQADGALAQKLDAYVKVNARYAQEFGKQKWVPEVQMGPSEGGNSAAGLIELLTTKTAMDLGLNKTIK